MSTDIERRRLLKALGATGMLAVLGPSALAACAAGGGGGESTAEVAGPLGDLLKKAREDFAGQTLNISCINTVQSDAIKAILGEFESATGMRVNMTSLAENAQITKISVSLAAKSNAFDLYQIQNVFVSEYVAKDWFVPVSELQADTAHTLSGFNLDAYAPGAVEQLMAAQKQIAMPMFLATQVYYYRTDLFQKAGIDQLPTTFDELEDVCEKLKASGSTPVALRGAVGPTMNLYSWGSWLYGEGGGYFQSYDAATNKYTGPRLSSPESVRSVERYAKVIKDYAPRGSNTWAVSDVTKAFLAGEVAMMQEGSPFGGTVNDPKKSAVAGKVAAFAVPAGPAGRFPPLGAQGWALPRVSEKKGAAWAFMQWATHPDTLREAALGSSFAAPPTPATLEDAEFVKKYDFEGFLDAITPSYTAEKSSPIGGAYTPTLQNWQAAGQEVSTLLNEVISGRMSAQDAMTRADAALAKYI
jgi:multiple sugar transport system substrate-binding protein